MEVSERGKPLGRATVMKAHADGAFVVVVARDEEVRSAWALSSAAVRLGAYAHRANMSEICLCAHAHHGTSRCGPPG